MSSPMMISVRRDREVVDGAAVVLGVDDGRRFRGEPREVLARGQARDVEVGRQEVLSVTGLATLPARIRLAASSKIF